MKRKINLENEFKVPKYRGEPAKSVMRAGQCHEQYDQYWHRKKEGQILRYLYQISIKAKIVQ